MHSPPWCPARYSFATWSLLCPLVNRTRTRPARIDVMADVGGELRGHRQHQRRRGEPVDLLIGEPVADPLNRLGVADRAERVIQGRERDAFLQALPLDVLVPVYLLIWPVYGK